MKEATNQFRHIPTQKELFDSIADSFERIAKPLLKRNEEWRRESRRNTVWPLPKDQLKSQVKVEED